MAKTTGDVIVEKLLAWGVDTAFGLPGRRDQRDLRGAAEEPGQDPLHPVPPRGGGRVRGLRLRQVHRAAGRLLRHQRPGRHPPPQRPLRRQARPRPGAGDHRPHLPRPDRHALPAGDRHPRAVQGRRRLQPDDPRGQARLARWSTSPAARRCRRGASSHLTCPADIQDQTWSDETSSMKFVKGHTSDGLAAADRRPAGGDARGAPRRCSTPGRRPSSSPGQGALGADRRAGAGSPTCSAAPIVKPLLGKAVRARRLALHHRRHRPARARGPPSRRWRSATRLLHRRHELPLPASGIPKPGQAKAVQIDLDPTRHRPALPGRRRPGRRRQGDAPGPPAAAPAAGRTARSWRRPRSG